MSRATLPDLFTLMRDRNLSPEEKTLWALYRSYETPNRGACVGDDLIAEHMQVSVRSVRRYRSKLLDRGLLEQEFKGPNPAEYRAVGPDEARTAVSGHKKDPEPPSPDSGGHPSEDKGRPPVSGQQGQSPDGGDPPNESRVAKSLAKSPDTGGHHPPHPPITDEYGSTGVNTTSLRSVAGTSMRKVGEFVPDVAWHSEDVGAWNGQTVLAAFVEYARRQGWDDPPRSQMGKMGAVGKRLSEANAPREIIRAMIGMRNLYPHSDGEPWDLFDLERKFAKAHAAAVNDSRIREAAFEREFLARGAG